MSLTSKQIEELRAYAADRKGELAKLINDAADTIELLSIKLRASQMERSSQYYHGGWIPCSERYPDMDERVLVYTVAHDYHVWDCMSNRADNYFWEDEEGLYHDKYEADLWMPLPDPWGGEEDGV